MYDLITEELRKIRIALVFIAVFVILNSCSTNNESHENSYVNFGDDPRVMADFETTNLIKLDGGRFGLLKSSTQDETNSYLQVYYYDYKTKKLIKESEHMIPLYDEVDE